MGLDIGSNLVAAVSGPKWYKIYTKEIDVKKKDKYGKEYTETLEVEMETLGTKSFEKGYDLAEWMEENNLGFAPYSLDRDDNPQLIAFSLLELPYSSFATAIREVTLAELEEDIKKAQTLIVINRTKTLYNLRLIYFL